MLEVLWCGAAIHQAGRLASGGSPERRPASRWGRQKTRTKPKFTPNSQPSCALFNRVLPPIDLTVRYGADYKLYSKRPSAGSAAARARTAAAGSKEAATVRRSVPGARRRGHARRRFSADGARTDTHCSSLRRSTLVGCSAARERPNGRRARDKAPRGSRVAAPAAAAHTRPAVADAPKRSAVAVPTAPVRRPA